MKSIPAKSTIPAGLRANRRSYVRVALLVMGICLTSQLRAQEASSSQVQDVQRQSASFRVKLADLDHVYLYLNPAVQLERGMQLEVLERSARSNDAAVIAELRVTSVGSSSAICEVMMMRGEVKPGSLAYLTPQELARQKQARKKTVAVAVMKAPPQFEPKIQPQASDAAAISNVPAQPKPAVSKAETLPSNAPSDSVMAAASSRQHEMSLPRIPEPPMELSQAPVFAQLAPIPIPVQPVAVPPSKASEKPSADVAHVAASGPSTPVTSGTAVASAASPQPHIAEPQQNKPNVSVQAEQDSGSSSPPANTSEEPAPAIADATPPPNVETVFKVKFVAQDTVYLSAGTATGLTPGMKLAVKHSEVAETQQATLAKASQKPAIAELEVISVARSSAVCEIHDKKDDIQPGDLAFLAQAEAEAIAAKSALSSSRKYPQVVTFSEGDPLEEEVRDELPRPPLPEVNRARGRIGFEYGGIRSTGSVSALNTELGGVFRADITRIGGTYWNLSGYWRGRLNSTSYTAQPTLQELINRTYTLNLSYASPTSGFVAGVGRLYLPWATSLDTLDGGYIGHKLGKHVVAGVFGGSTPDPTSWDYNPDRHIAGAFLNLSAGSFDSWHLTSTSGFGLSALKWQINDPFVFFENGLQFKRYFSLYDSTQADDPRPIPGLAPAGKGLSRNFFTARFQPFERISFDVNDNYFRDVPTFDTALIATGLLDKYLFQGLSVGARVEPIRHISFYTSVGRSSRTGDTSSSWNEMYGVTVGPVWKTGVRVDARTSKFDSSFGSGRYSSLSFSRNLGDSMQWQLQLGEQALTSQLTTQTNSRFVNANIEANLSRYYFLQGGYTVQRGGSFNYDQWTMTIGYRFDNRAVGVAK